MRNTNQTELIGQTYSPFVRMQETKYCKAVTYTTIYYYVQQKINKSSKQRSFKTSWYNTPLKVTDKQEPFLKVNHVTELSLFQTETVTAQFIFFLFCSVMELYWLYGVQAGWTMPSVLHHNLFLLWYSQFILL